MRINTTKRAFALVLALCMVLTLLPVMSVPALAATSVTDADYSLELDTTTNTLHKRSDNGTTPFNKGADYEVNGATLTLKGITFSTSADIALYVPDGITIVLIGENTIESTFQGANSSCAITSAGTLTIQGSGVLNVKGGGADDTAFGSYGIGADTLVVESGTINATGGDGSFITRPDGQSFYGNNASLGIKTKIFRLNGGTVNATGGEGCFVSYGISASTEFDIISGTVTATGGKTAYFSRGMHSGGNYSTHYDGGGYFKMSGGTVTATGGDDAVISHGIDAVDSADISGGTLNAFGGNNANNSVGLCSDGRPMENHEDEIVNGNIMVSGGTVTVQSGAAMWDSFGMFAKEDITVNAGIIIANGAASTNGIGCGIFALGDCSINDGIVVTTGGNNTPSWSLGIRATNIAVSGGTVDAKSGDGTYSSGLAMFNGGITISGGTVIASAPGNQYSWYQGIYLSNSNITLQGDYRYQTNTHATAPETEYISPANNDWLTGIGSYRYVNITTETLGNLTVSLTAGNGKVTLAPQTLSTGYQYYYKTTASSDDANKPLLNNTTSLIGWTKYSANTNISWTNGSEVYVQIIKVQDVTGLIKAWGETSATPQAPTTPTTPTPAPTPETPSSNVIVDGKEVNAGEVKTSGDTTTVTVNQETINKQLETANNNVTVVVPAETGTAVATLVVQNVDDMAAKDMTLTIQVGNVQYEIPTTAIDTTTILAALGAANAADVPLSITITTDMSAAAQAAVDKAIASSGGELVIPPMEFKITATYEGRTVEVDVFSQYVARSVEITAEQAEKITTAVVVEPDGTTRQVPTRVYQSGGKWYAEVNSLTNSTYAFISNEQTFADAKGKWYEATVNEMASRMVINGVGDDMFAGERDITRAEFAAIIVRALGLPATGNGAVFSDVSASAWYAGAVGTAYEYGLVSGVGGNQFAPDKKITRQEAMLMIQRMAKVAGFSGTTGSVGAFSDNGSVSDWALDAARWNVGSGLIVGSGGKLNPTNNITRAETATLVLKLMQKAGLVDVRTKF